MPQIDISLPRFTSAFVSRINAFWLGWVNVNPFTLILKLFKELLSKGVSVGSMIEGVKTVNSAIRTLLLAVLAGIIGMGAYFGYNEYTERERVLADQQKKLQASEAQVVSLQTDLESKLAEIGMLNIDIQEKEAKIDKLETSMHLLKTDQRLARLEVLGIERDEEGKAVESELQFVELSPQGDEISEPKTFRLPGDVVYIDNWIVKFDDSFVEQADIQRGTSLCLFRRIFSEQQMPNKGFSLDEVGMRPQAYAAGGKMSEFEETLWSDFWEFANDPAKAAEMGIRAANGEAVSIKIREGKAYSISLRASGGLSITPSNITPGNSVPKDLN